MLGVMMNTSFSGKTILVTGASGFIGSRLLARFNGYDAEIHAISRSNNLRDHHDINWWQGDLSNFELTKGILAEIGPDYIFHLASQVTGSRKLDQVIPTFSSNLMTTVNLLTAVAQTGCERFIISGSMEEPKFGDLEAIPRSPYAAAKWSSSVYARMFHKLYEIPVVNLRIFMVYGPGKQDWNKLVPYVILSALSGDPPKINSGQRMVDWVFVEDVIDGILACTKAQNVVGQTFELGSGKLVSIRSLVNRLISLTNSQITPIFSTNHERPFEQNRLVSSVHAYSKIGWKPETSLDEGLRCTVNWFKENFDQIVAGSLE